MSELTVIPLLKVAVRASTSLIFTALGEVYAERSGILNLGLEGIMLVGAVTGFITALTTGNPWLGIVLGGLAGGLLALIHAVVSISLRGNQIISGLALTMLGIGVSGLVGRKYIGISLKHRLPVTPIPLLKDVPILGPLFFDHDLMVYFSYIASALLWFILYMTKIGIYIRAVGEDPSAADAAGVNVFLVRYACTIFGGFMAGIGGAYLSVVYIPMWIENMTAGRGWIALAIVIFALWDPLRVLACSYIFGILEALQYWLQRYGINPYLLGALPYLITIVVLSIVGASERLRRKMSAPSSLGKPYSREERSV